MNRRARHRAEAAEDARDAELLDRFRHLVPDELAAATRRHLARRAWKRLPWWRRLTRRRPR